MRKKLKIEGVVLTKIITLHMYIQDHFWNIYSQDKKNSIISQIVWTNSINFMSINRTKEMRKNERRHKRKKMVEVGFSLQILSLSKRQIMKGFIPLITFALFLYLSLICYPNEIYTIQSFIFPIFSLYFLLFKHTICVYEAQ